MSLTSTVVILAAGQGARMYPLTNARPKTMIPLAGKPILEHLLGNCRDAGITDFVFVVGYYEEVVRNYFGDGTNWAVNIRYAVQRKPQGTADALRQCRSLIQGPFIMVNGDVIPQSDDISFLRHQNDPVMCLTEMEAVSGKGVVELSGNKVVRIYEKTPSPPTRLVNAGAYHLTRDVFEVIEVIPRSIRGEYEITDALQYMINSGISVGYHFCRGWHDITFPWELLDVNAKLLYGIEPSNAGVIEKNTTIKNNVVVGRDTLVRSGAYIVGPVIVGDNCDIGPNCYIRPYTVIGDNCRIGSGVEIKNSIIMAGTRVPHQSYIGDSVIGERCNLGAGTQVANLRLDNRTIDVGEEKSGRNKLGVLMGDKVLTGINSSINPGTIIGEGVFIGPGAVANGIITDGARSF